MKILVIRLSSIGDVVLTTPVVRCIKQQVPQVELHYLTRSAFTPIMESNPYVDKTHAYHSDKIVQELKNEHFDLVIDLQKNHRSRKVCSALHVRHTTFPKKNLQKWLIVNFKVKKIVSHISDRYFLAAKSLHVTNDGKGLDYFFKYQDYSKSQASEVLVDVAEKEKLFLLEEKPYVVLVAGANHVTKTIPPSQLNYLACNIKVTTILIGGENDRKTLSNAHLQWPESCINLCGKTTLAQSAFLMKHAACVIAPDTGMMHIASALNCKLIAVWGCTTPDLGFAPYRNDQNTASLEVELSCRPCSKLGRKKCPKGHFRCMLNQPWQRIANTANDLALDSTSEK